MTGRRRPSRDPAQGATSCPRATLAFVGREAELARIAELFDEEIVFLIYGVAGIGKTELAYRALEIARERADWQDAVPTLVQIQPGMSEQHLVAVLRRSVGVASRRAGGLGGLPQTVAEELDEVVHALESRPRLLFLDDLHLIDTALAGRVLEHLARHVRASRVFAASRLEIPLPTGGVTPVITRLAPLNEASAQRMLAHLGRRLGVDVADVRGILHRAGGSPFFLQREVASSLADAPQPPTDQLEATLRVLPRPARRLLVRASVIFGRITASELAIGGGPISASLAILARHFFVDIADGAVAVHDLVREAALRLATPHEVLRARRAAARILLRRAAAGGGDGPLAAVEAVRQLCASGDHAAALARIADWHGLISGAGLDHLLLDTFDQLRAALPGHATAIDLLVARTLVRRGVISEAQRVLAQLGADARVAGSVRYLTLAGMVASQRGDLRSAEAHLQSAYRAANPAPAGGAERARVALHLADVLSMRGETARARALLAEVQPACEALGGRAVLRWGWSVGLSWVLEEEFTSAIATVAPFRERAERLGADDLAAQLTMLEVLSRAELHDGVGARELTDRIVAPAARAGALRAPIASFYMGITTWAEGDTGAAERALRDAWIFLQAHHNEILGLIVGHYLARVLLVRGDVHGAIELFARTTRRAVEIGCDSITAHGDAYHAFARLAAGDTAGARALTEPVLAAPVDPPSAPTFSRMLAHQVLALASAYDADLAAARRHLDAALALAAGEAAQRIDTLLVRAELELCGGDPAIVVQAASAARNHYAARGRRSDEAHACVVLAAGHAALGAPGDLAMAEEALARSDELIARHGYEALRFRTILVRAAILGRNHERAAAEHLLREALAHPAIRPAGLELMLGSALGSRRNHELPAGIAAQLARLGLDHAARREEITIDRTTAAITTRFATVKGRPVACALLACLADHQGQLVPADVLYCTAWGAREYHPLRHRNRLYVALKRLRQILDDVCGARGGELIETLPGGWRLATGVVARKTE